MFIRVNCLFVLMALSIAAPGYAQSDTKSATDAKPTRVRVDGMRTYYDPGNVKKNGDSISFKVYPSPDPAKEEGDEYSVNCKSQEMSAKEGGRKDWSPPSRLLAGESVYPIAKKFCEWGPGFWQKLTE